MPIRAKCVPCVSSMPSAKSSGIVEAKTIRSPLLDECRQREAGRPRAPSETKRARHTGPVIKAFADSVGGKTRKTVDAKSIPTDLILHGVTDPVLRARIGLLLAELKSTRAQLLAARHLANQNAVLDLERKLSEGGVNCAGATSRLSPLEICALENAISKATLTHWGWRVDAAGRIVTDTGQTVFAAGFVTAIGKVLEGQQSDHIQSI